MRIPPLSHSKIAALFGLGLVVGSAQAALNAVDTGPYLPANGDFAAWYQDTHGRALDLCLSKAVSSRVAGAPGAPAYMCSLLPNPGVFDDAQPIAFPSNFPDEAFWFTGDAFIQDQANTGIDLTYVSALEAAFGGGLPAAGDQISFARIRIRVDVPVAGTYIITHPYGVEVFNAEAAGTRAINMTRDIGIGAPGVYTGALGGDVGPFLRSVNGPYNETNPDTGAVETFIGDPNLPEPVTGSPFGTNYVRIEGPNGIDLRTDNFVVSGKLSSVALPTPMIVDRTTYARSSTVTENEAGEQVTVQVDQQDVFVEAPPPPATASFIDTAGSAPVTMTEADTSGSWYGQSSATPTPLGTISVSVDNSLAIPTSTPTTTSAQLVDLVTITSATFSLASGVLTLEASSSDETAAPTLAAKATSSDVRLGDLAGATHVKSGVFRLTSIPPAQVTVTSANGGSDTEQVVILP